MFIVTGIVLLIGIFLVLIRAYLGPTVYDRILALNAMGTKTVVFVALLGWISERPDFLDIALLYALMNYISTITILKFIEKKRLDC
jgi:multicomponent Na+:H+ antiporter subunit F